MAEAKKPNSKGPGRPKRRQAAPKGSALTNLPRPRRTAFEDSWEGFVDRVQTLLQKRLKAKGKLSPYDTPSAVLKRMTYKFMIKYQNINPSVISTAISNHRINVENVKASDQFTSIRTMRKPYKGNEAHWILTGLNSSFNDPKFFDGVTYTLESCDITRFSDQLHYAFRHEVPPEYLIGFLYQCGTVAEISAKARDPHAYEKWFKPSSAS